MFLESLTHLKSLFYRDNVITDDPIFRLTYGFTSYFFIFSCLIVTGPIIVSENIVCNLSYNDGVFIPKVFLNTYCYIRSTFIVPNLEEEEDSEGIQSYPGVGPHNLLDKDLRVYHSYYQWVGLVLFLQGVLCYVPKLIWSYFENDKMKTLRGQLNNPLLTNDEKVRELEKLRQYFICNYGLPRNSYGKKYLFVLFLNWIISGLQICASNWFLGGKFIDFGIRLMININVKGKLNPS